MGYNLLKSGSKDATIYSADEDLAHDIPRKQRKTVWNWLPLLFSNILNFWLVYLLAVAKAKGSTQVSSFGDYPCYPLHLFLC